MISGQILTRVLPTVSYGELLSTHAAVDGLNFPSFFRIGPAHCRGAHEEHRQMLQSCPHGFLPTTFLSW